VKILAGFHGGEASRGKYMCENPRCRCQVFYRHGIYERFVVELSDEAGFKQLGSFLRGFDLSFLL
jgi:hypothetical protein